MSGTLDPAGLRRAMEIFLEGLREHREEIDSLNVFPVPDADTGTNLVLTQEAVVAALGDVDPAVEGFGGLAARIAEASLRGARGNAGAILAQLLGALAGALPTGAPAATGKDLAGALARAGVEAARAVARPVEGTALTVAHEAAQAASASAGRGDPLIVVAAATVTEARASLARTRETNPVLRRAGVVDAGGKGIVLLFDALRAAIEGTGLTEPAGPPGPAGSARTEHGRRTALGVYEVQFLVDADEAGGAALREALASLGDSVVVAGGAGRHRAHVHTHRPGPAVEAGIAHGPIRDLSIVYLDQASEEGHVPASALVALGQGPGLARVLTSLGAVVVPWEGAEPPPDERILEAIRAAAGESVLVLAGHPAAADAAARAAAGDAGRARVVMGVRSAPAALAAATAFNPLDDADRNAASMASAGASCRDGELRRAGDGGWTARTNDEEVAAGTDPAVVVVELARGLGAEHADVLTVVVGEGVASAEGDAVAGALRAAFPRATVDAVDGGQSCWPFLIGVE